MKILKKSVVKEIEHFFSQVITTKDVVVVWQYNKKENKRLIYNSTLGQVDKSNGYLSFMNLDDSEQASFRLVAGDLFFYIEKRQAIFKSELISSQANLLIIDYPQEVKLLDENDEHDEKTLKSVRKNIGKDFHKSSRMVSNSKTEHIQTKMVVKFKSQSDQKLFEKELDYISPDEEDKIFAAQREAPRARAHKGKKICIARRSRADYIEKFELFDLSRGGFSYVVNLETHFTAGDVINVVGFDHEEFDNPMIGQVMGVHVMDQLGTQYKVGCKFLDEDEIELLLEKEQE